MEKFIEKLIGRLEEKSYKIQLDGAIVASSKTVVELSDIKENVNQLAEEHNNDFCEWEIGEYGDLWKPSCGDTYELRGVRRFKFCPYCGKKTKVVE